VYSVLAAYSAFVVIRAAIGPSGHGGVFWTAEVLIALIAVAFATAARRNARRRRRRGRTGEDSVDRYGSEIASMRSAIYGSP